MVGAATQLLREARTGAMESMAVVVAPVWVMMAQWATPMVVWMAAEEDRPLALVRVGRHGSLAGRSRSWRSWRGKAYESCIDIGIHSVIYYISYNWKSPYTHIITLCLNCPQTRGAGESAAGPRERAARL